MWASLYVFFFFMLIVWGVVELLFWFIRSDSISYDTDQLWDKFSVTLQDMHYPTKKK
ncbi:MULTISPECIES: hypothetical protein [Bacillales]|uniref:Uncharacterized protein n=1 Tax=Brevibacillus aydinogluensis TaxID=927786 RepID=A0AA48RIH1_9BACL|nr:MULTISPECIES: hypothetical protein [Bacillales]MBR8660097.1 hypothetical protein [Brevibacillus sp. NL20B1]MDT3414178.1 hypothetical protein [Brevibacillus aydinogluensis]UFJ59788.1 hypothetical protein IRT44_10635 [Anoxybacillus sediminis]CAJ1003606.1 hypothetical protein BSPP4475_14895 [Brevibacillus aydinogluensis]